MRRLVVDWFAMNDIRQGTCPLCGHNEIYETRRIGAVKDGLYLTVATAPGDMFARPAGQLWSYSCRRCDYTQLFAQGTAALPVDPKLETRIIVGPPPAGPFR